MCCCFGVGGVDLLILGVVILGCCPGIGKVLLFCGWCCFAGIVISGALCLGVLLFNYQKVLLGVCVLFFSGVLLFRRVSFT